VAKALSSTTPSSHILVRRKSESSKTEGAGIMTSSSSSDTNPAAVDTNPIDSHSLTNNVNSSTEINTHSCTTEKHKVSPSEEDKGFDLCAGKSLVADYSDSDSGSESL